MPALLLENLSLFCDIWMKGAFSSADEILGRQVKAALYPDTTYAYESGGDPEFITDLTYETYLEFYHTYYHPSNSYIYLYGDIWMKDTVHIDRHQIKEILIICACKRIHCLI